MSEAQHSIPDKKVSRIIVTRKISELEAIRFFRLYKYHEEIIETVEGGRSWLRTDVNATAQS